MIAAATQKMIAFYKGSTHDIEVGVSPRLSGGFPHPSWRSGDGLSESALWYDHPEKQTAPGCPGASYMMNVVLRMNRSKNGGNQFFQDVLGDLLRSAVRLAPIVERTARSRPTRHRACLAA